MIVKIENSNVEISFCYTLNQMLKVYFPTLNSHRCNRNKRCICLNLRNMMSNV
uniref:Uncharacterized protein n=1 Tax=Rhizophora mucronata TaxID=61149 RepID=A0A2P2PHP6_RHIMU